MSVSTNTALSVSEKYHRVLDWVSRAGPENFPDLKSVSFAVKSIQGSLERVNAPAHLHDVIEKIDALSSEHRSSAIAEIDTKISELLKSVLAPASTQVGLSQSQSLVRKRASMVRKRASMDSSESKSTGSCVQPPFKKSKPTSIKDVAGLPLLIVADLLDPRSQAQFAQVSTMCRDSVYLERRHNLNRFLKHKELQALLPSYLQHVPAIEMERNSANWSLFLGHGSEVSEVVTTILPCVLDSDMVSEEEKAPFRGKSLQEIVSNVPLLYSLLKTDYDRNLVLFSAGIAEGPQPDLSNIPTLSGKAEGVRKHFEEHKESISAIVSYRSSLTCIPQEIFRLSQLKRLCIEYTRLRVLPPSIEDLKKLTKLDLGYNHLSSIPSAIGSLSSLKWLCLCDNHLSSLPDTIGSLCALQDFTLSGNHLSSLPNSIGSLCALRHLSLFFNHLSSLPDTIGFLSLLEFLNLDYNRLSSLPNTIGSLSALEQLSLDGNPLEFLPDTIGSLPPGCALHLNKNQLLSLSPESIDRLQALTVFWLLGRIGQWDGKAWHCGI